MTRVAAARPEGQLPQDAAARDLARRLPGVRLERATSRLGRRRASTELNVRQPDFFAALDSTLQAVPLADWKTYLRWHVARAASPS